MVIIIVIILCSPRSGGSLLLVSRPILHDGCSKAQRLRPLAPAELVLGLHLGLVLALEAQPAQVVGELLLEAASMITFGQNHVVPRVGRFVRTGRNLRRKFVCFLLGA